MRRWHDVSLELGGEIVKRRPKSRARNPRGLLDNRATYIQLKTPFAAVEILREEQV